MKKQLIVTVFFLNAILSVAQSLTLEVSEDHFFIAEDKNLIVSHLNDIASYADLTGVEDITLYLGDLSFSFNDIPAAIDYKSAYNISYLEQEYSLYFTSLPLISIETPNVIINEEKVLANFIYSDEEQVLVSKIGIELRGGFSLSYPKKTYDLEFWGDDNGVDNIDVQFGNLRSDDDWILDALYNEPLRIRSYIASKLWKDMHVPHYLMSEPKAKSGADVSYVEVFINGSYNGLYNISEQVDKKLLQLKTTNEEVRGELYKGISWGATTFGGLPSYSNNSRLWGGYELKYPKADEITEWENIYNFTDFVINAPEEDFKSEIWEKFNYDNFLDYYIFLNIIRATDNTGKNIYIGKYDTDSLYFYIPWDLDGCFGTMWEGNNDTKTTGVLTNGFYDRVGSLDSNDYLKNLAKKWFDFRKDVLEEETLINLMKDQYYFLLENKMYERESLVYQNYDFSEEGLFYMLDWLQDRIDFLDYYFDSLSPISNIDKAYPELFVFPNPSNGKLFLSSTSFIQNSKYRIINTNGIVVDQGILKENALDVEFLNTGIYIIIVDDRSYKLVIK